MILGVKSNRCVIFTPPPIIKNHSPLSRWWYGGWGVNGSDSEKYTSVQVQKFKKSVQKGINANIESELKAVALKHQEGKAFKAINTNNQVGIKHTIYQHLLLTMKKRLNFFVIMDFFNML